MAGYEKYRHEDGGMKIVKGVFGYLAGTLLALIFSGRMNPSNLDITRTITPPAPASRVETSVQSPEKEYLDFANKTGDYSNYKQPAGIFQPYVCPSDEEARQNSIDYRPRGYLACWDNTNDMNSNARQRRRRKAVQEGVEKVAQTADAILSIHGLVKYGPKVLLEIKPVVMKLGGK